MSATAWAGADCILPGDLLLDPDELIVDLFAGGGGASSAIEEVTGRSPDVAINHDRIALGVHAVNHPKTLHLVSDVWHAEPAGVVGGLAGGRARVGLLWLSPDCKHHSKAKGGRPVKRAIRDLASVAIPWARRVRPRLIVLENVEEFADWGPLLKVVEADGAVTYRPCPDRRGDTFRRFVGELERLGYRVEWRELRACDYGAPTIRRRLFLVARRDGLPIVWPAPSHARPGSEAVLAGLLQPWRAAWEVIDWSRPCPSIFLTKEEGRALGVKRPLVEATMARIGAGTWRYVVNHADPFIVPVTHAGDLRTHPVGEPLRTITTARGGELAVVAPFFSTFRGGHVGRPVDDPLATVTANGFEKRPGGAVPIGLVAAFLAQHNSGVVGHDAREPVSTIVGKVGPQALVAAHLVNMKGAARASLPADAPVPTLCAGGTHVAEVRAFLVKYFGAARHGQDCREPLHSVTTKPRFGLVTVAGADYRIADIGMRMLHREELKRAQGFRDDYVIDRLADGTPISAADSIRLIGNSVSRPPAAALLRANLSAVSIAAAGRGGGRSAAA